jgi:hypothetical protein
MTDIVDVTELVCSDCGGSITAHCNMHGPQENATLRRKRLLCVEWDIDRGDECWQYLNVSCEDCGSNDIEGLE